MPLVILTSLIAFGVIHAVTKVGGRGGGSGCWRSTGSAGGSFAALFDRERLISGTRT